MEIEKIGYNHTHDKYFKMDVTVKDSWWLFLLIKTPALFTFDGVETVTKPNSFVLFSYGHEQHYRAYGDSYTDDWFHLRMDYEDIETLEKLGIPINKVAELNDANEISMIIRSMAYEFYSENTFRKDIIDHYLKLLFLKLSRQINDNDAFLKPTENLKYDHLLQIRNEIFDFPQRQWSVDSVANMLSVSRSTIQHTYKKIFGTTISGDIILSRISRAKYYLTSTGMTVAEIAEECGYSSDVFFMRQFKQIVGKTPSEYRRKI